MAFGGPLTITTPTDTQIVITRQFDAPRHLVFACYTQPALIKRCAGTDCSLWFVDRTKAHGRMFCSAAACGNRAKVAAFRQRQREAEK